MSAISHASVDSMDIVIFLIFLISLKFFKKKSLVNFRKYKLNYNYLLNWIRKWKIRIIVNIASTIIIKLTIIMKILKMMKNKIESYLLLIIKLLLSLITNLMGIRPLEKMDLFPIIF